MNIISFYPKLAWEGICKNQRLYFPYILTGSVMVMMYYILSFLVESPALSRMPGGSVLMTLLSLGCTVIAIFSLLFLFYTNSFLVRQRYREFGLYNILGMDKRNISRIMVWECLFVALFAIVFGLVAGIALSKAAELVLLNLLGMDITFDWSIGVMSLKRTPMIYGGIYLILLCNSLIRVRRSKPLELMQSSKVGERIPKRNWVYGIIGTILLGVAYYLSVSIEEPLAASTAFFVAVILVIVATYLLFISGSVVFCRLLQSNKRYYYKANHFVSVSTMVYRMKRNGAGLASICILLTMVLVMISSTASLYFGGEEALQTTYPNGVNFTVTFKDVEAISNENMEAMRDRIRKYSGESAELTGVRSCEVSGLITEEGITIEMDSADFSSYDNVGYLSVVSLEDYNDMMGIRETLAADECLVYCDKLKYTWDTFTMEYGEPYKVKRLLTEFVEGDEAIAMIMPTVYVVVENPEAFFQPIRSMKNRVGNPMVMYNWHCGFDMDTPENEIAAANGIREVFHNMYLAEEGSIHSFSVQSREAQRESFLELHGSLFFLGIMLSIVFLLAAVLIIYYKQISEGYEDFSRFAIMQKVGMTRRDIRKSINSQMLTVFFLPLIFAGLHLAFAFLFLWKMLMMFGLNNMWFVAMVMGICFVIFGVFYTVVYKITSRSYYSIGVCERLICR